MKTQINVFEIVPQMQLVDELNSEQDPDSPQQLNIKPFESSCLQYHGALWQTDMSIGSSSKLLCLSNSKQIVRALKRSKIVLLLGGNCFHILLPYAELLPVCTIRKVYLLTNTSLWSTHYVPFQPSRTIHTNFSLPFEPSPPPPPGAPHPHPTVPIRTS